MTIINKRISAGEFKSKCLKLMDEVNEHHSQLIITKRGKPVAKLVPIGDESKQARFGCMTDTMTTTEDIVSPIDEEWDAMK